MKMSTFFTKKLQMRTLEINVALGGAKSASEVEEERQMLNRCVANSAIAPQCPLSTQLSTFDCGPWFVQHVVKSAMAGLRRVFALNRTVDRAMPCQAWSHSPVVASTAEASLVGCSVRAPSNYGAAEPQAQRAAPADSMPGNSGADGAQACLHFRCSTLFFQHI